jgi:hypothetical protein
MTKAGSLPSATSSEAKVWRSLWGVMPVGRGWASDDPCAAHGSRSSVAASDDAGVEAATDLHGRRSGKPATRQALEYGPQACRSRSPYRDERESLAAGDAISSA